MTVESHKAFQRFVSRTLAADHSPAIKARYLLDQLWGPKATDPDVLALVAEIIDFYDIQQWGGGGCS